MYLEEQWSLSISDSSLIHVPPLASSATTSDKPDVVKIEKFDKWKLKKIDIHEKDLLPSKEMNEHEKQAGES
ncbi:thymosin beta-4-like [Sturnira hondurensis]|uniref:thymosin beta-4-like n=1 Tax=Sturnira hondurensis TaxID=192404 RepID=UPI00187AA632|nr:thymosin beta-4-like [Sturnira hondurensis]